MNQRLILAVDGSEQGLILLHQVVVHLGYPVVLAGDDREVVTQAARHRPAAIVLGLHGDGRQSIGALRGLATEGWAATTPLVVIADGWCAPEVRARARAVMQRPIALPALAAALRGCFETAAGAEAAA